MAFDLNRYWISVPTVDAQATELFAPLADVIIPETGFLDVVKWQFIDLSGISNTGDWLIELWRAGSKVSDHVMLSIYHTATPGFIGGRTEEGERVQVIAGDMIRFLYESAGDNTPASVSVQLGIVR